MLRHADGPTHAVTSREIKRIRTSASIVHGNFNALVRACDDISTTGLIEVEAGVSKVDVSNEVYRLVHNYVSSLYSYNEQVRNLLSEKVEEEIHKGNFLPDKNERRAPEYVRRLTYLWGLRNDFQHGEYWCLKIEPEGSQNGYDYYHLYFDKRHFEATPQGELDDSGDYLAHAPDEDQRYPLLYIGDFHRNLFASFEQDVESWCARKRP